MSKSKLWTKDFVAVSMTSFFIFVVFYMMTVTLPLYATDILQADKGSLGLIVTVFLISAIIFRPLSGKWMITFGQKRILVIGAVLFLIGSVLYSQVNSLSSLLLLRVLHGVGFGMATTATGGIVANVIPDDRRGEGMGYFATFMNLAMVIGPFMGLTLVEAAGHSAVFTVAIVASVLGLLCSLVLKVPTLKMVKSSTEVKVSLLASLFEFKALPIALAGFVLSFAYASIISFVSVFAKEMNFTSVASYFFVVYAVCLLLSRPFTGKWFDRYGENFVVYPAILLFTIGVFLISQASSGTTFLLAGGLIGIGFGTLTSSLQSIAIKVSPPHRRGVATATFFVLFDSGLGVGSSVLAIVSGSIGYQGMYIVCAVIGIVALVAYYALHGRYSKVASRVALEKQVVNK
ncbi:MFS transporter [Priestia flexa]|uniref:MFS transporter n=1 Tax=Priestia flexa TaxID=86664 RepID=UPI00288EC72E|nr:MFS transporter [Priestia flexa]MDT2047276.1 MFS transporter [Priestia flexa]